MSALTSFAIPPGRYATLPHFSASQGARAANIFELGQNRIAADEILQPRVAHHFLLSPQTCCHASNSLGLIW